MPTYEKSEMEKLMLVCKTPFHFRVGYKVPNVEHAMIWDTRKVAVLSYKGVYDFDRCYRLSFGLGTKWKPWMFFKAMGLYGVTSVVWKYVVKAEIEIKMRYLEIERKSCKWRYQFRTWEDIPYAMVGSFEDFVKKYMKYEYLDKWAGEMLKEIDFISDSTTSKRKVEFTKCYGEWISKFGKWLDADFYVDYTKEIFIPRGN